MKAILFRLQIGDLFWDVQSYMVFVMVICPLAFFLSGWIMLKNKGVSKHKATFSAFLLTASIPVSAKIGFLIFNPIGLTKSFHSLFALDVGYSVYGGFLVWIPLAFLISRHIDIPSRILLDCMAPGWSLGIFFGKIGCFLNGCCFGIPTYVPWGVVYPEGSLPHLHYYGVELGQQLVAAGSIIPYRIHPVQLYESAVGLFAFMLALHMNRKNSIDGLSFSVLALIYCFCRLCLYSLRETSEGLFIDWTFMLSLHGIIFLCALAAFVSLIRKGLREKKLQQTKKE